MYILGISAYYHDSAAVLLKNGEVVCAFEEERFSLIKHDNQFPLKAIQACIVYANITIEDIQTISYYERPLRKFERILSTFVETFPYSLLVFVNALPEWFSYKLDVEGIIRKKLLFKGCICYVPHHLSHASHAFFTSTFETAAVLTIDGVGEYQTTGLWKATKGSIEPIASINFPHSLGLLYSTFTAFLGFQVNEDEYKVMGLAAYGTPTYEKEVRQVIDIKSDGSFKLNLQYFGFRESFCMWKRPFEILLGTPRAMGAQVEQRHKDIAASIQKVVEEIYLKLLIELKNKTDCSAVCISGGVSLNALANGRAYKESPFVFMHIPGAGGDSGAALGAALYTAMILNREKVKSASTLLLGNQTDSRLLELLLQTENRVTFTKVTDRELIEHAATHVAQGGVIGWFQGRMEFGPRALGNRSILALPAPFSMKERVNDIKMREEFRPFGGAILEEYIHEYFDAPAFMHSFPDMNVCFQVKKSGIEAITHADNSCRIQTVSKEHTRFYELISVVKEKTGTPCVLNTSFNVKGQPIVENPQQAITMFLETSLDVLYIENYIIEKIST